jgi:integrase
MQRKLEELVRLKVVEPIWLPRASLLAGSPMVDERTRARRRLLSQDELLRLARVAHPEVGRIVMGAFLTLLRKKDLAQLSKTKNWDPVAGELRGVQAKTGLPYVVPVGEKMAGLIAEAPTDLVFDFTCFRRRWDEAIKQAGLPGVQLKDLRRTGARAMLAAGADIATVSAYLGHATITMTQRYVAAPSEDLKKAGNLLCNFAISPSEKKDIDTNALVVYP